MLKLVKESDSNIAMTYDEYNFNRIKSDLEFAEWTNDLNKYETLKDIEKDTGTFATVMEGKTFTLAVVTNIKTKTIYITVEPTNGNEKLTFNGDTTDVGFGTKVEQYTGDYQSYLNFLKRISALVQSVDDEEGVENFLNTMSRYFKIHTF